MAGKPPEATREAWKTVSLAALRRKQLPLTLNSQPPELRQYMSAVHAQFMGLCSPRKLSHTAPCHKGCFQEAGAGESWRQLLGNPGREEAGRLQDGRGCPPLPPDHQSICPRVFCGTEFRGSVDMAGTDPLGVPWWLSGLRIR